MKKVFYLIISLCFFLCGCSTTSTEKEGNIIAQVGEAKLFEYDLEGMQIDSKKDSSKQQNIINSWIKEQLILQEARRVLPQNKQDFKEKVEDYHNSLLIYAFEKELLSKSGDTTFSSEEIEAYYKQHKEEFKLRKPLIKCQQVITNSSNSNLKKIKDLIKSDDLAKRKELEDFCLQYAYFYELNDSNWHYLDNALKQIPSQFKSKVRLNSSNDFYQWNDSTYAYLIYIEEHMSIGSPAPLEFEKEQIKNILLLKKKKNILNRYYEDLWAKAVDENKFNINLEN